MDVWREVLTQLVGLSDWLLFWIQSIPRLMRELPILLILLPLMLRRFPSPERSSVPWRSLYDLPLAVGLGIAGGLFHSYWLVEYHLPGGGVTASDFDQYCALTAYVRDGMFPPVHYDRSTASVLLPGYLAQFLGIMDGLAAACLVSSMVLVAAIYLWARALHSRLAGISAAILSGVMGAIVLMPRFLTFYPQWAASFTLCAACAAICLRWPTQWAIFFSGSALGLALLLDVRGLIWGLPQLGLTLLAVFRAHWKWIPVRMLVLAIPLALSFYIGSEITMATSTPLEKQVAHFKTDGLRQAQLNQGKNPVDEGLVLLPSAFLWGHSNPLNIPLTIRALLLLEQQRPELARAPSVVDLQQKRVGRWLMILTFSLLIGSWGLRRRPWQLFALWGTSVPFVMTLWESSQVWSHLRVLSTAAPVVPVLLGVAFATLAGEGRVDRSAFTPWRKYSMRVHGVLAVAMVYGATTGILPTFFSPVAPWRHVFYRDSGIEQVLRTLDATPVGKSGALYKCWTALRQDITDGHPVPGVLTAPGR